jgi:hypothetical protein
MAKRVIIGGMECLSLMIPLSVIRDYQYNFDSGTIDARRLKRQKRRWKRYARTRYVTADDQHRGWMVGSSVSA